MYIPPHFEETDSKKIKSLLEAAPLGIITAQTVHGLEAHHIPLLMQGDNKLIGHIAKANDLHKSLDEGARVLVIFRADDAYVSPNWYPSKKEHHKHVPTWNYRIVHIEGSIHFHHDDKKKRAAVGVLTRQLETRTNGDKRWKMSDAPQDYMEEQLNHIVAFDISITRILGKSKLSQNKQQEDIKSVSENLQQKGQTALAQAMLDTK